MPLSTPATLLVVLATHLSEESARAVHDELHGVAAGLQRPGGPSGGRRGVPRGRPVRSPDRAKQGYLKYGQVASRILYRSYIDQQISPCFLQDLQSEWKKEQMQKNYEGVKSEKRCEVVTVGRRAARGGESRSHQT